MANRDTKTVVLTEFEGKKRTTIKKGSIYKKLPFGIYKWLNAKPSDDFVESFYALTEDGRHVVILEEAKE